MSKKKTLKIGSIFRKKLFIRRQYSLVGNFLCFCFLDLRPILAVSFFFDKFWNFFRICNLCHIFGCFSALYSQILMTQGFFGQLSCCTIHEKQFEPKQKSPRGFFPQMLVKKWQKSKFSEKNSTSAFFSDMAVALW